jgi:hypothetical protein
MRRRSVLLAATGGMAAIAGCGYIPGKGDKMWETELSDSMLQRSGPALLSRGLYNITFRAVSDGVHYADATFDTRRILAATEVDGQMYGILEDGSLFEFSVPGPERIRSERAEDDLPAEGAIEPFATLPNAKEWTEGREFGDGNLADPILTGHGDSVYVFVKNGFAFDEDRSPNKTEWSGYAFDTNGRQVWSIELERGPDAAAASEEGLAFQYSAESDDFLQSTIRYYSADGDRQWTEEMEGNVAHMFISDGYVYAIGYRTVRVFEASTGKSTTLSASGSSDEPPVFGPQRTSMYATDPDDKNLTKVNLETHSVEWELDGVVGRPATDGDSVFVPTEDGLLELDAESGTERWSETAKTVSPDRVLWVGPESIRSVEYGDYLTARYR